MRTPRLNLSPTAMRMAGNGGLGASAAALGGATRQLGTDMINKEELARKAKAEGRALAIQEKANVIAGKKANAAVTNADTGVKTLELNVSKNNDLKDEKVAAATATANTAAAKVRALREQNPSMFEKMDDAAVLEQGEKMIERGLTTVQKGNVEMMRRKYPKKFEGWSDPAVLAAGEQIEKQHSSSSNYRAKDIITDKDGKTFVVYMNTATHKTETVELKNIMQNPKERFYRPSDLGIDVSTDNGLELAEKMGFQDYGNGLQLSSTSLDASRKKTELLDFDIK